MAAKSRSPQARSNAVAIEASWRDGRRLNWVEEAEKTLAGRREAFVAAGPLLDLRFCAASAILGLALAAALVAEALAGGRAPSSPAPVSDTVDGGR